MTVDMGSRTPTAIKICGITKSEQAKAISNLGVQAIGVIGVKNSPRFVEEGQRRKLFSQLNKSAPNLKRVWVIADLDEKDLAKALKGDGIPSVVQLHGSESKRHCSDLLKKYPSIEWWKALRIRTKSDLLLAKEFENEVDSLLLDAWSPKELGGTGHRLPLKWLQELSLKSPWWLAGGISAEWIPEVLRETSPFGVDASSRLEISPGIKDLKKVISLVKAVRELNQ